MIILNEKTIGMWYIPVIPGEQDFMGALFRDENDELIFEYRFRYYHSDDPFDHKDKKNWYTVKAKDNSDGPKMLEIVRGIVSNLSSSCGEKSDEILMKNGDTNQFINEMKKRDWFHGSPMEGNERCLN